MFEGMWTHIQAVMPDLWRGAIIAVFVVIFAETIGVTLGLLIALLRLSGRRLLAWPALVYVDLMRGTPMMVQILFVYFALPAAWEAATGNKLNPGLWIDENWPSLTRAGDWLFRQYWPTLQIGDWVLTAPSQFEFEWRYWYNDYFPFIAGVIALGLNSGAYVSEVFRTAIGSIDRGQAEAALALGLGRRQTFRHVIFPQAFRWAIPPLGNEFVTLLKDTSLLFYIGVVEILKAGQLYAGRTYAVFPTYVAIAIVYIILTLSISNILRLVERKLKVPT